jgi:hypothetical protein
MMWEIYIRKGIAYIPTMARTEAGFYLAVEPVEVASVGDKAALEQALVRTISRGNPIVPTPTRANFPQPVLLSHAKVKSWSTFAKSARGWSIAKENDVFVISPYHLAVRGALEEDSAAKEAFPQSTPVVSVVQRAIERITQSVTAP